jgi:hypothetical protein
MAMFLRRDDKRSELQIKLAAELQERAKNKAREDEVPDGVHDSAYIKNTKHTSRSAWIWIVGLFFGIIAVIMLVISSL